MYKLTQAEYDALMNNFDVYSEIAFVASYTHDVLIELVESNNRLHYIASVFETTKELQSIERNFANCMSIQSDNRFVFSNELEAKTFAMLHI